MSVIRTIHNQENPYVQLNKKALWDPNLSLTAVGLWARCMSRPDDWTFCVKELISKFKEGKDAIYRAINELIKHGYAIKGQRVGVAKNNDKSGKRKVFQAMDYIFFEFKISLEEQEEYSKDFQKMFPLPDFPLTESPLPENPPLLKKANKATKTECLKRANNRGETTKSPESLLSDRKKEVAYLSRYSEDLGFNISERDLGIWLSKYDTERIKRNISLAKRRKWTNLTKFLQSALRYDYAKEEENIEQNKSFLTLFCKENGIQANITQKYVTFSGGYDIQLKLCPSQFNKMLLNYYSKL